MATPIEVKWMHWDPLTEMERLRLACAGANRRS